MIPIRQLAARRRLLHRRRCAFELLDARQMLSAVPYGASSTDTAEYMLGEIAVTVVLMESNGQIDPNLEDWTPSQIEKTKQNVIEGLKWWEDLLSAQNSVHTLNFVTDFKYADEPVETGYEPISRKSDDFELWMDDFFATVGIGGSGSFSDRIRIFNHHQRLRHDTNWAFTIFVVNADHDADHRFDTSGSFSLSFAFPGGEFFVATSERPASSIAHETAHMFWAMDEYAGSKTYLNRRGYYNTQNLNAHDGHPDPNSRVRSIMDSTAVGYSLHVASPTALESIGWRDSDGDGIFDVLDVPHLLEGTGSYDAVEGQFRFQGTAQVQTLPNLNRSGNGNDMTINRIDRIEVRMDSADWQTIVEPGAYQADLDFSLDVPPGTQQIIVRAVDLRTGVVSNTWQHQIEVSLPTWRNLVNPLDVNHDTFVSPLDALLVINHLNTSGSRLLAAADVGLPSVDVNGDGFLSPIDALQVINDLNQAGQSATRPPATSDPEGESTELPLISFASAEHGGDSLGGNPINGSPRTAGGSGTERWDVRRLRKFTRQSAIADRQRDLSVWHEPTSPVQRMAPSRDTVVDLAMLEVSDFRLSSILKPF